MRMPAWRVHVCRAVAVIGLLGAGGCRDAGSPVRPSNAAARSEESSLTVGLQPGEPSAGHITPAELADRGWTCFTPPVPNRIVCSRPNQGFPTVANPPPAGRPATFTFFVFDGSGRFVGPEFLIRTDLYNGQMCEATGELYVFVPVIGYYECVHAVGRG
jgi:hypothetical protein